MARSVSSQRWFAHAASQLSLTVSVASCEGETNECKEVENIVLADDEATPEGAIGLDVLGLPGPAHQVSLTWHPGVTNAPTEMPVPLSVEVQRADGEVRYVVTEQVGTEESNLGCGPTLNVPVRLLLNTEDGALDDVFEGSLVYDTNRGPIGGSSSVPLSIEFSFEDLAGWLELIGAPAVGELNAVFGFDERGTVAARRESSSSGNAVEEFEIAAHWGTAP